MKEFSLSREIGENKIKEASEFKEEKYFSEQDYRNILKSQIGIIETRPFESLREENRRLICEQLEAKQKEPPLTEAEKKRIKEEHPDWPDSLIDAIGSWKEYEIYDNAKLVYAKVNGRDCLIRSDIDWNQKDEFGRTNKERVEQNLAPLDKNGNPIELHHIGQKSDSPLAELTKEEHRGKGNDGVLHDKTKESEIDRGEFAQEKDDHWKDRAKEA